MENGLKDPIKTTIHLLPNEKSIMELLVIRPLTTRQIKTSLKDKLSSDDVIDGINLLNNRGLLRIYHITKDGKWGDILLTFSRDLVLKL